MHRAGAQVAVRREAGRRGVDLARRFEVDIAARGDRRGGRRQCALEHLSEGIRIGGADAVLAASIFHYGEFTVGQAKALLARDGIPVRL